MNSYNYDNFATTDYNFDDEEGPRVGEAAPDFLLHTVDGNSERLLDFDADFLVLEMGSMTCPLFQSRRPKMESLETKYPNLRSAVLYVREAHPGDAIPGHKNFADKRNCACRLRDEDGETRKVFIDNFDGHAHAAYGSMPNAVFIINRNGCVVYRSEWNNPSATEKALRALIDGKQVVVKDYFRPALPQVMLKTLRRGGKGSFVDFFRGFPFLFWTNLIKRNLRILFGRSPNVDPMMKC